jgi:hypothetical protein
MTKRLNILEEITEAIEWCCSLQSWKKVKQVPGSSIGSVGGSEKFGEGWGGRWIQALLRLYAFWQV